ncbi:MAG: hypothetical protein EZS28_029751 [Streblomastix strix]|uniref:Uncharacterized protein n=1 Tax=Streblomastix strix TaxID=222440 RepID=A0A5J4UWN6_9EUKA|nr:MAG: hypothetical protein EZS28_029751 [Streblomastix strix]
MLPFELEEYVDSIFDYENGINGNISHVYNCAIRKALAQILYGKNYLLLDSEQQETVNNFDNVDSAWNFVGNSVASSMSKITDSEPIHTFEELLSYLPEYYGKDIKKQVIADLYKSDGEKIDVTDISDSGLFTYVENGNTYFRLLNKTDKTNPISIEEFLGENNVIENGYIPEYEAYLRSLPYVLKLVKLEDHSQAERLHAVVVDLTQLKVNEGKKNIYGVAYVSIQDGFCYLGKCKYIFELKNENTIKNINLEQLIYYFHAVFTVLEQRIGFGESIERSTNGYEMEDIESSYKESGLKNGDIVGFEGKFTDYGINLSDFKKNLKKDLDGILPIGSIIVLKDGVKHEFHIYQVVCFKDGCNIVVFDKQKLMFLLQEEGRNELREFVLNHFTYHKHKSHSVTYEDYLKYNIDGIYIYAGGCMYANKNVHRIAFERDKAKEQQDYFESKYVEETILQCLTTAPPFNDTKI